MQPIENMSRGEVCWTQDGLTYTELICQEYGGNGCKFSAGSVEGHPIDTMYIAWGKDGHEGDLILLTPDELSAVAWVASGAVWVHLFDKRLEAAGNE